MNRRQVPSTRRKQPGPQRARFSRQEKLILGLVAFLGSLVFILAGFVLLDYLPEPADKPIKQPASQPQSTPLAGQTPLATLEPVAALPAGCRQVDGPVTVAVVSRVLADGALEVQIDQQPEQVSYAGVAPFPGISATNAVLGLLNGQTVTLIGETNERDGSGRLPRYVFSGERFINLDLVSQGLGKALLSGPNQACAGLFQQAELRARAAQLGGWMATPAPTRTFLPFVDISTQSACDCSIRYECGDFTTHVQAQTCYNACNDYSSRLDDDRDGIACEELP